MRTERSPWAAASLAAALVALAAPDAALADEAAAAPERFTVALPAEVTLVGLTWGARPEVLYRPWARGSASRVRLAVGVLDGRDQLFVPLSLGYRAIWRSTRRVRPSLGAGLELQHRLVDDYPAVRQYGVYVEGGVDVAVTARLSLGLMIAIDVMLYGGPGIGLGPRLAASCQL